jgi:hypothetical protein
MFSEDTGFINFPLEGQGVLKSEAGKTMVYLVSFDPKKSKILSNIKIKLPGTFVSDDVINRSEISYDSISSIEKFNSEVSHYDRIYFPSEDELGNILSISMISSICVGWSNFTFESRDREKYWFATFRDLTNKGKELYYTIKKLHFEKEVRLLTFNNI